MKNNTDLRLSAIAMVIAYFTAAIISAEEYINSMGIATRLRYDDDGDSPLEKLLFNIGSGPKAYLTRVAQFNWVHFSDMVKMDARVPNVVKLPFLNEYKDRFISTIEMGTDTPQKVMEVNEAAWEALVASILPPIDGKKSN